MKKIVFLTGTRADYGKFKSLMKAVEQSKDLELFIFVTGMHMNAKYGKTVDEIIKENYTNIFQYINHDTVEHMDRVLAKTIDGFSHYVKEISPDMIIVHGDRPEALAGAVVGSLNNILVSHVEGGEVSGTIDELIRHAVSKLSHIHFVSNNDALNRLVQLGEVEKNIFVIGSPDFDLMNPKSLPELESVKLHYQINFDEYAIAMYHPVTTEIDQNLVNAKSFVNSLISSDLNYIVIYPNNDIGSSEILREYERLKGLDNIRLFPSLRFESFLVLLQNASFIIGNSSAGVREAPYYSTPTIDIGTRQMNRVKLSSILHSDNKEESIIASILSVQNNNPKIKKFTKANEKFHFGDGASDKKFIKVLESRDIWDVSCQKQFKEINH